jgi:hypothetical protein
MDEVKAIGEIAGVLALIWTGFQEWRHRRDKKAKGSVAEAFGPQELK